MGEFPYPQSIWKNPFDQLKCVVHGDPPRVPADAAFSPQLKDFVRLWWALASVPGRFFSSKPERKKKYGLVPIGSAHALMHYITVL